MYYDLQFEINYLLTYETVTPIKLKYKTHNWPDDSL